MVSFSYVLNLPLTASTTTSKVEGNGAFKIDASIVDGEKKYYEALAAAVGDARRSMGAELTAWKDRVGNAENDKESRWKSKSKQDAEGDDLVEGEEDEEG